jgi:hypothetical protein
MALITGAMTGLIFHESLASLMSICWPPPVLCNGLWAGGEKTT